MNELMQQSEDVVPTGRKLRRRVLGGFLGALLVATLLPVSAGAQVPEVPEPIPSTVQGAIQQLATDLTAAAQGAGDVVVQAGFALRPACAAAGTAFVAVILAGSAVPLPFNVIPLTNPIFVVCAFAFAPGPADPVFGEVDAAVGPTLITSLQPALDELDAQIAPHRPSLVDACSNLTLLGGVDDQFPPPLNRIDFIGLVCG